MYKVIKLFTDLQDKGYRYEAGDTFPRKGLKVSAERLAELAGPDNRQGTPLIEKVEPINKAVKGIEDAGIMPTPSVNPEEAAEVVEEKPKPRRNRKPKTAKEE